jgi:hypothetical protein
MSRLQLAFDVSDIDEAFGFPTEFRGTEPAKPAPGDANFAIADSPLKLVLVANASAREYGSGGALNHLGLEVEMIDEVASATGGLNDEGLKSEIEDQTTCCSVNQDEAWVSDPDGTPWEVYTVVADAPEESGIALNGACCVPEATRGVLAAVVGGQLESSACS